MTLFPSSVKADIQLASEFVDPVKNWSFEYLNMPDPYVVPNGVYECPPWETNKPINSSGGWRELRGDISGDGTVNIYDAIRLAGAFGSAPGDPEWNPYADINGDGAVNIFDAILLSGDFGEEAHRVDGSYSWYTSGGGDYQMWQWLDADTINAIRGKQVKFSFWFFPESVASDGSENYAKAEIYYEYSGGETTVDGAWIAPTELDWLNAYVTTSLPSTVSAVKVIIHGKPNFKAYLDFAKLTIIDEAQTISSYGTVTLAVATHYWFRKSIQPDGEVWFVPALHAESAAGYGIIATKLKIELWEPQEGFLHIYYCYQANEEGYEIDPGATEEMQLLLLTIGGVVISIGTGIALGFGLPFVLGAVGLAESQFLGIFTKTATGFVITTGAKALLQTFASDPNVQDSQEAGTNYVLERWGDYPTYSSEYHPTPFVNIADGSANVQWLFNSGSAENFKIKITASVWWGEVNYYPGHYDGSHWELDPVGWTHAVTYMTVTA